MSSNDDNGRRDPVTWDHAVQFYETDDFLCDAVSEFVSDGLVIGEPVVILATRDHRDALMARMQAVGLDWEDARRARKLRWMDARAALESIMIGRRPDPARFQEHVGSMIRASLNGDGSRDGQAPGRVRAYGELVDLLWREGEADAALTLEDLWNDLGRSHSFSLLCAYGKGNVYQESRGRRYREVCGRHAYVLPAENETPA